MEQGVPPVVPAGPPADLAVILARIDERLDALEAAVGKESANRDELAKVAWAVQHGRKRPW